MGTCASRSRSAKSLGPDNASASGDGESDAEFVERKFQDYRVGDPVSRADEARYLKLARRAASPDAGGEVTKAMVRAFAEEWWGDDYGPDADHPDLNDLNDVRRALRAALAARGQK